MEILYAIMMTIRHFIEINWPYFSAAAILIAVFAFIATDTQREARRNEEYK